MTQPIPSPAADVPIIEPTAAQQRPAQARCLALVQLLQELVQVAGNQRQHLADAVLL